MKFQKKKKRGGRKAKKQARKKKHIDYKGWLTPKMNKYIRRIANHLTRNCGCSEVLKNKRFYCDKCKRVYCFTFSGTIAHCEDCFAKTYCGKEIRNTRTCNCEEEKNDTTEERRMVGNVA